jgi:hypothetical protein
MLGSPFQHEGVVIGKHGLREKNAVQFFLFECHRRVDRDGLTMEQIFDVIDAIGLMDDGMLDGVMECRKAEVFF